MAECQIKNNNYKKQNGWFLTWHVPYNSNNILKWQKQQRKAFNDYSNVIVRRSVKFAIT